VRVVALEQAVAAPLCSRHLGDLGADVVKLERPDGGDFARGFDSIVKGQSAYFVWLNRGKRSVKVDLGHRAGVHLVEALLQRADIFVHNLGPGVVERFGFGWSQVHSRFPALIVCTISGYGAEGPYRDRKAFDLLVQGEAAVISTTGTVDEPAKVGISIADISGGMYALASILASLYERQKTGQGRLIEISLLDCLTEWMMPFVYHQMYSGTEPARTGLRHAHIVPYGPYRAQDGVLVNIAVQTQPQWERFCAQVMQNPSLSEHPLFLTNEVRVQNRAQLETLIADAFLQLTSAELEARLVNSDIPFGRVNSVAGLVAHPQLAASRRWIEIESEGGTVLAIKHPLNISGLEQLPGAVPRLGEHTHELISELGLQEPDK